MKKLRTFLSLNKQTKKLFIESYFYLAWARILKILPFSKMSSSLGEQMKETTFNITEENRKILSDVSQSIYRMSRYTFWESECLVKAIAAMKMLERRQIESTLYLGTAKDKSGKLVAHAWLRSGPYYITGKETMDLFTVVSKFAKHV